MAKLKREKITVDASYYNFEERYEEAVTHLDDRSIQVVSVNVLKHEEKDDSIREELVVFYREVEEIIPKPTLPRHGEYEGNNPLYTLDEVVSSDIRFDDSAEIMTILADNEVIFEHMTLEPQMVFDEIEYWKELERTEGRLLFAVWKLN